jgi:hypothetical protein
MAAEIFCQVKDGTAQVAANVQHTVLHTNPGQVCQIVRVDLSAQVVLQT